MRLAACGGPARPVRPERGSPTHSSDPAHAPSFTPGATLYFQWWSRDPAANLKGFNLSDALAVTLEP